ncbi:MAG: phosphotransferase family protein, partial [Gammaproteobacteria bacterium]|nr:phosphotransferase family protein [Gammaproteobacteria bacterium]
NLPGGSICPATLTFEYGVYERLQDSDIPVPGVYWYEDSAEWTGDSRPFYVRDHVEGDWNLPHFLDRDPQYDGMRIAISQEHISHLAKIHTCDWQALGFDEIMEVPKSPADCAETIIVSTEKKLAEFQMQPFPVLAEAREWLLDNAPRNASRISLLKGTNGLGEEVFRDGKIVAMSDWELAALGDPAYDWAQIQDLVPEINVDGENIWGLQKALNYYEDLCGIHVDATSVQYYRVLYGLIMTMFSHNAGVPLVNGTDLMARLAWVSTEMVFRGQSGLAAVTGIVKVPEPVPGQLG